VIRRPKVVLAVALMMAATGNARAHGDEDHAAQLAQPAVAGAPKPRMEARTATLELVAAADADDVTIWVDRWADNVPITDAAVSATVDGKAVSTQAADGVYTLSDDGLIKPGRHQLTFVVTHDGATASMAGTLMVSAHVEPASSRSWWWWLALPIGLLVVRGLLWRLRDRRGVAAVALAPLVLALLLTPRSAPAHGDGDHAEPGASVPAGGDSAAKLSDGQVFGPKPLQRAIALRTVVAGEGVTTPTAALTGRIIADPRRGGLVQSSTGGRVLAPAAGLPIVGQYVRAGQVLAMVEPPLQAVDQVGLARDLTDLDQQIALAANRSARLQRLEGVVPRRDIDEARITLAGLRARRAALGRARTQREVLTAPISGVVSVAGGQVGQVVTPQTTLFQIVDPARLFVEASLFDRRLIARGSAATARTADGATFTLAFEGAGLADTGRAATGLFRVVAAPARLRVGEPVTVDVPAGAPIAGAIVPREAVISGASGVSAVFVKTRAETFVMRPAALSPVDAGRVALTSGVKPGERVVTTGAAILAQVR